MSLKEPLVFEPLAMERIWGGRRLETLLHKSLPSGTSVGETWEIVDRPEAQSVVHQGLLKGKTLHELWTQHREEIFGQVSSQGTRFPLLVKILDARERLSVQVHPPASVAKGLGGEPKTEMWYFLDADPGAKIYAGLKSGTTRESFEQLIRTGKVEEALHVLEAHTGDSFFIPSGRVHAIGGGNLIIEAQQNSDTTYRVFDWNRTGLDGNPRKLHIEASLCSIDFEDFEPSLIPPHDEEVANCEYFTVEKWDLKQPRKAQDRSSFSIFVPVEGKVACCGLTFDIGEFFLLPAPLHDAEVSSANGGAKVLRMTIP